MGAIGPVLGGWLIDTVGWRSIFFINLPPAVGAIVLALLFVRDKVRPADALPLDLAGGALATLSLGVVTWGLTMGTGPDGWSVTATSICLAGLALGGAFLWLEHRLGDRAMMPLAMFGSRTFAGLTLLTLLLYGALGALMVLVPYVLIQAAGYSGTAAGAALLPFAALLGIASPLAGSLAAKTGPRIALSLGPLIVAVGFALLLRVDSHAAYWSQVFPAIVTLAVGMTITVAPLTTAVLSSVDDGHTGAASGLNSAVARSAGMIATAVLGGVLAASGSALISGFHLAAIACCIASLAASLSAWLLVSANNETHKPRK